MQLVDLTKRLRILLISTEPVEEQEDRRHEGPDCRRHEAWMISPDGILEQLNGGVNLGRGHKSHRLCIEKLIL